MKKLFKYLICLVGSFAFMTSVNAASGSIVATSSSKTVVVGSTFTVTVKVSCTDKLGSAQFGVTYDSAVISLQSGDTSVVTYGDGKVKSKSFTYKFKAIKSGTAAVRVTGASMVSWDEVDKLFTPSVTNTSVNVKTQKEIEASYSKDNNLKSLSVQGFTLSPAFSKDVTSYTLEVPDDTESIKVNATVNDANASVRGVGVIDVSEGSNKINVVVTAQNGSTKTYTIDVNVKDLKPINVSIDGKDYTVVKKADLLTSPTGFSPVSLKINDIDVPAFYNELAVLYLVGLKDSEGKIELYIYDRDNNGYKKYNELRSASVTIYPMEPEKSIDGFDKTKITINDNEYDAFTKDSITVLYGMNIETGKKGYYKYDKEDNTFIRYVVENGKAVEVEVGSEYKLYTYALTGLSAILLIISVYLGSKNSKLKKLLTKFVNKEAE